MNRNGILLSAALLAAGALAAAPKVDRYGQYTGEEWPGKVKKDADMRNDLERELRELSGVKPGSERFDRYGGVREGAPLEATGFFRTQKENGRWWLVTPEGNRFYLKGVDAVPYLERGYFTQAKEQDGRTIRRVFTEGAPDPQRYPDAWRSGGSQVNFLAANLRRKYGPEFRERWMELTEKRLRAWGFNASGKWNNPFVFDRLPFLLDTGLEVRRIGRCIDPWDPAFETRVEAQLSGLCGRYRDEPLLIGYQFENENGWSRSTPLLFLKDRSGTLGAKRTLLERLAEHAGGDAGSLFGRSGATLDELMKEPLDGAAVPRELLLGFIRDSSRRYHEILRSAVRRHDPDHLFLGASHCAAQSVEWIGGSVEFVDVIPLHEYNLNSPWIGGTLAEHLKSWDKPFAVLEFSFTNAHRGYGSFSDSITVGSEADRGRAFQICTERLAANPLCVGTSYFILHDQPVTSRGHDAEAYSFGLVDTVDRPYREMLPFVAEANSRVFDIHAGKLPPVPPRPLLKAAANTTGFMPESLGAIRFDSSNPQHHNNRVNRIRFSGNEQFGVPLPVGTVDAGRPGGFRRLEFRVFLWKNEKNRNPDDWFRLEESADNVNFTPAAAAFRPVWNGAFREYAMTPQALKPGTRYVRLSFVLHDPAAPWASSLAEIRVER